MSGAAIALLLLTQTASAPLLSKEVAAKRDANPRTYRFVCDYWTLDARGDPISTRRFAATYDTDRPKGRLAWRDGSVATAVGPDATNAPRRPIAVLDGLSYAWEDTKEIGKSEAFKKIPAMTAEVRNLLWDAHMFESYAHTHLDKLRLNVPFVIDKDQEWPLAESGSFYNRSIDLTWIGSSALNGQACALLRYRAFLNRFVYNMGTVKVDGTSDFWGEIWLAKKTNRIELATLYESVAVTMGGSGRPMRVFRVGTFERVPNPRQPSQAAESG
ncbi:MAG: hypothetical protein KIS66_09715 [Fimbriimonadaceae bacterium]|nr:hypothetical protein [Fimbriimonadaceae bacterium]